MPSSLKWRVYVTANNGSAAVGMAELAMRSSIGGANLCSGGTASASSAYPGGYDAAKAFDGLASTFWDSNGGVPQWIEYDFATAQSIVEIAITAPPAGNVNDAPQDFSLQYWDGAAWIPNLIGFGQTAWSAGQTRTFSDPTVAKKSWRLYITAIESGVAGVAELGLRTTAGSASVATGGTAVTTGYYQHSATYAPSQAFDANAATFWDADVAGLQILQYNFAAAQNLVEYAITAPPGLNATNAPKTWKLQYNDGLGGWADADTRTAVANWTANEVRVYAITGGAAVVAVRPQVFVCT